MTSAVPAVAYLQLGSTPRLVAEACDGCGALHLDHRQRCGRCGGTQMSRRPLQDEGTIRTYTVVYRSAPGVAVPFTSVVVDLDGGGTVRGGLVDPPADPSAIAAGDRARMVTRVVGTDIDGTQAIAYAFELEKQ